MRTFYKNHFLSGKHRGRTHAECRCREQTPLAFASCWCQSERSASPVARFLSQHSGTWLNASLRTPWPSRHSAKHLEHWMFAHFFGLKHTASEHVNHFPANSCLHFSHVFTAQRKLPTKMDFTFMFSMRAWRCRTKSFSRADFNRLQRCQVALEIYNGSTWRGKTQEFEESKSRSFPLSLEVPLSGARIWRGHSKSINNLMKLKLKCPNLYELVPLPMTFRTVITCRFPKSRASRPLLWSGPFKSLPHSRSRGTMEPNGHNTQIFRLRLGRSSGSPPFLVKHEGLLCLQVSASSFPSFLRSYDLFFKKALWPNNPTLLSDSRMAREVAQGMPRRVWKKKGGHCFVLSTLPNTPQKKVLGKKIMWKASAVLGDEPFAGRAHAKLCELCLSVLQVKSGDA